MRPRLCATALPTPPSSDLPCPPLPSSPHLLPVLLHVRLPPPLLSPPSVTTRLLYYCSWLRLHLLNNHTHPTLPPPQIAVQVALVYAKVARFDYPADWPGLFADLLANVNGGSALTVRRWVVCVHAASGQYMCVCVCVCSSQPQPPSPSPASFPPPTQPTHPTHPPNPPPAQCVPDPAPRAQGAVLQEAGGGSGALRTGACVCVCVCVCVRVCVCDLERGGGARQGACMDGHTPSRALGASAVPRPTRTRSSYLLLPLLPLCPLLSLLPLLYLVLLLSTIRRSSAPTSTSTSPSTSPSSSSPAPAWPAGDGAAVRARVGLLVRRHTGAAGGTAGGAGSGAGGGQRAGAGAAAELRALDAAAQGVCVGWGGTGVTGVGDGACNIMRGVCSLLCFAVGCCAACMLDVDRARHPGHGPLDLQHPALHVIRIIHITAYQTNNVPSNVPTCHRTCQRAIHDPAAPHRPRPGAPPPHPKHTRPCHRSCGASSCTASPPTPSRCRPCPPCTAAARTWCRRCRCVCVGGGDCVYVCVCVCV